LAGRSDQESPAVHGSPKPNEGLVFQARAELKEGVDRFLRDTKSGDFNSRPLDFGPSSVHQKLLDLPHKISVFDRKENMFGIVRKLVVSSQRFLGVLEVKRCVVLCSLFLIWLPVAMAQTPQTQGVAPAAQAPANPATAPAAIDPDQSATPVSNPLILRRFDNAAFEAAQKAQRLILLVFTSADSPTCRIQVPTITKVMAEAEFRGIEVFQVDLASQRDVVEKFGTPSASSIVSFRGTREVVRSQGMVKPSAIRRHLRLTL
jgi:thioredoxin 1